MPRVQHTEEFIKERNRANQQRYREKHAEELKERRATRGDTMKKRESRRAQVSLLIEAGVFEKLKPGRKRLYTPEEALEVAKKQRPESWKRLQERLHAAKALLAQRESVVE